MAMTPDDYSRLLGQLLPPGLAWNQDPESVLQRLLSALSKALARVEQHSDSLCRETDPRQTYALLERWEDLLGLPDSCSLAGSQTVLERVQAIVTKLIDRGGQRRSDFIALAESLGYSNVTLTEYRARRHGRAHLGEPHGGDDWEQAWQLNLPNNLVVGRRYGLSGTGEPYRFWGDSQLECIANKRKPAGSILFFAYGGI